MIENILLEKIDADPKQPRQKFLPTESAELKNLIQEKYNLKNCLNSINAFLKKDLSFQDIDYLEKQIDLYWNEHYKDFNKYYDYEYLYISLNCFKKYSKNCILKIVEYLKDKNIKKILDFGAGIGLTTNMLQDLFSNSQVYYNNLESTIQSEYFLSIKNKDIKILNTLKEITDNGPYDIIIASELFEHIEKPISLLKFLMKECNKYFVTVNSFNTNAYGHFKKFEHYGISFMPNDISKLFLRNIRTQFKEDEIKAWNSRPRIFKRNKKL